MPRRKLPYKEGDFFALPLRTSGFGVGIATRINGKGGIIGYFLPEKYPEVPSLDEVQEKQSGDTFFIGHFGDLGFFDGGWKVIGSSPSWDRKKWPLPSFVRTDLISGKHYRISYLEKDLDTEIECVLIGDEEASLLPEDGVFGYGALEIRLTKLLNSN
ncbi:Imm26 family immunity protein [Sulfidibacter corallicola]|uniref:Immunity protein 26 n=1 Tax=Sulfidibacter corallicola TaxID=2818388 RepID=A0A8A4TXL4_SULCO|nr:Imm26 family immunity protein [Sulfidibacter corallicola]QTD54223.1 hypothetical protein J3U87_17395 [Sulfidibacter corallicola]